MKAQLSTRNKIVIVALSGRVDVETAEPFHAVCTREFSGQRLVFDFSDLSFVGSQGMLPFLKVFQAFYEKSPGSFKFSGMGVEFRRLFSATALNVVELYETIDGAVASFASPRVEAGQRPEPTAPASANESYLSYNYAPVDDPKKTSDSFESDEDLAI